MEKDYISNRWAEIKKKYNKYRLFPPKSLIDLLVKISKKNKPNTVLDIGCGTGLSTKPWSPFVKNVIGMDPSEEMLSVAKKGSAKPNIQYKLGTGNQTNLPNNSVDIVTSAHSIHWMEPNSTIAEILRVLKKDGMFVLYGHTFPPLSTYLEVDSSYFIFKHKCNELASRLNLNEGFFQNMADFSSLLQGKNLFRYYREFYFHQKKRWKADDYIGWLYTHGVVQKLLKKQVSEDEFMLTPLKQYIYNYFGDRLNPMILTWRVIIFKNPNSQT